MSGLQFQKATKRQARLRLAIIGPSGAGKTYTALAVATELGAKVALIDTERGSASKYAGDPFEFDALNLDSFSPLTYAEAIRAAEAAGYEVLVIDSLSHAWSGKDGALEQVDRRASGNKFSAWREVTPMHQELVDTILSSRMHVVATMRAKTEYAVEQDGGKTKVVKLGLAPVQRDGIEFEFDVVGDIDQNHNLRVTKTRCRALDGAVIPRPGADLAATLRAWLGSGEPEPEKPAPPDTSALEEEIMRLAGALGSTLDPVREKIEEKRAALGAAAFRAWLETQQVKLAANVAAKGSGSGPGGDGVAAPPAGAASGGGEASTSAAEAAPSEPGQSSFADMVPKGARGRSAA